MAVSAGGCLVIDGDPARLEEQLDPSSADASTTPPEQDTPQSEMNPPAGAPVASSPCWTLCGDAQLVGVASVGAASCAGYAASLEATDRACTEPDAAVVEGCCIAPLSAPPAPASRPCVDLCGGDQMVGPQVLADRGMTCWDYANSIDASDTRCVEPDGNVTRTCCEPAHTVIDDPFRNLCCLCGDCTGALSGRGDYVVSPDGRSCDTLSLDLAFVDVETEAGAIECEAAQMAMRPTCCEPDYLPPPEIAYTPPPPESPCEQEEPPTWCEGAGEEPTCQLCLDGRFPGNPYTITTVAYISGNPSCEDLYWMGLEGAIPDAVCYPLQNFMQEPCGC